MRRTTPQTGTFEFVAYDFQPKKKRIVFRYRVHREKGKTFDFAETVFLPRVPRLTHIPAETLSAFLRALHMALGVSYYKVFCPPKFRHPYKLHSREAAFWNTIYKDGFGEFLFKNKLDPSAMARFHASITAAPHAHVVPIKQRALVGIGGGKDSLLTTQLFSEHGKAWSPFVIDKPAGSPLLKNVLRALPGSPIVITREIDRQLLSPIQGSYQGHVPISIVYGFLGCFAALLYGYQDVVVSNEYSSSFGNVRYRGLDVNHQWSKSIVFESMFQDYLRDFLTPSIRYFSVLRPFYELRIVKMFAERKKYLHVFSSCNTNFRQRPIGATPRWCGTCPKCAASFALFAAFLPRKTLVRIFQKDLFADVTLLPLYRDLLGLGDMKPFDCVSTFEEVQAAFLLAAKKWRTSPVVRTLLPKIRLRKNGILSLFETKTSPGIPSEYRFLGMNSVLVLGYGKEGRATRRYLRKYHPSLRVRVSDERRGDSNEALQHACDIAIKSPGIPKEKVFIQYTTATNLFFSRIQNRTIGVTASKGKSTTASLIHAMLTAGKVRSELLGNIGRPMLEALLRPVHPKTVFVLELSSFQLDDIERSPNVALVLNLFPEHLDYHGSLHAYYAAKERITRRQTERDVFVYDPRYPTLRSWANETPARAVPIERTLPLPAREIPLLGRHNHGNVAAAATVARRFGVTKASLRRAVKMFKALPHRLERVGVFQGIEFYDDAISTTPESTIEALRSVRNVATILLGGEDRGYDFSELERELRKRHVKNVVLFPETGRRILRSTSGFTVLHTRSMNAAVRFAFRVTPPGTSCLLSTASPSYSLWKDFQKKGDEFQTSVRQFGRRRL